MKTPLLELVQVNLQVAILERALQVAILERATMLEVVWTVMEVPAPQPKDERKMRLQKIFIEMTVSTRSPRTNSPEKCKRKSQIYHE